MKSINYPNLPSSNGISLYSSILLVISVLANVKGVILAVTVRSKENKKNNLVNVFFISVFLQRCQLICVNCKCRIKIKQGTELSKY